ncbi:hypothetical protein GQ457_01G007830 [Hibiscus cannabinus]
MSSSDETKQLGIVFGSFGGIAGLVIVARIISKRRKTRNNDQELERSETERARANTKMLTELAAYYRMQPASPFGAAVDADVEAVLKKQPIERLIELVLNEKPARFSGQLLQITLPN